MFVESFSLVSDQAYCAQVMNYVDCLAYLAIVQWSKNDFDMRGQGQPESHLLNFCLIP